MTSILKILYILCKVGDLPIDAQSKSSATLSLEGDERGSKKADSVGTRKAAFIETNAA